MNPLALAGFVLLAMLVVRGGGRRAAAYHRSLVSRVRGLLFLAGALALGMWWLNTRYGGS
jgi:hypothetical protein